MRLDGELAGHRMGQVESEQGSADGAAGVTGVSDTTADGGCWAGEAGSLRLEAALTGLQSASKSSFLIHVRVPHAKFYVCACPREWGS